MNFSRLRHRIVLLKPMGTATNELGESVPLWLPFHPFKGGVSVGENQIFISEQPLGFATFVDENGEPYKLEFNLKDYEVWASVAPTTGREYSEAQKLRAETTYNVITRFFPDILPDMKILFKNKIFNIVSVLNIDERNEQLKIVATERVKNGESE